MDLSQFKKDRDIRKKAGICPKCNEDAYICTGISSEGTEWTCTACNFTYPQVSQRIEIKPKKKKKKT